MLLLLEDVKKAEDTSDEGSKDSGKAVCPEKNEATQEDKLKSESPDTKLSLNGIVEGKPEAELDSENINAKAQNIKKEPVEMTNMKLAPSEPALSNETTGVSIKAKMGEGATKNHSEEIQQAMKNDQQAKIPLKKRGKKFSEGFEKNGSIMPQIPSAPIPKEASEVESTPGQQQKIQRVNDQVNGEVQPQSEREPLKESAADKEQTNKSILNALPAPDKDGLQDKKYEACRAEFIKEAKSQQSDSKTAENVADKMETEKREAHKASQPSKETIAVCKDLNNGVETSSNHETPEKMTESKSADEVSSAENKSNSLKEADKLDSSKSNHEIISKEAESVENSDTTESNQTEESTKTVASESNADKSDPSALQEKLESVRPETRSADKVLPGKCVESESPGVIKKSDEPLINDQPEKTVDKKESETPPALVEESESSKFSEKGDDVKETIPDQVCEKKTENPKDVKKMVNCDDNTMCNVTARGDTETRQITEETLDVKSDPTKPQEEAKTELEFVISKATDDMSEQREKPSSPVEKTKTFEETDETSRKQDEEKEPEKDSENTRTGSPPSESIKDAAKDNKLSNVKEKGDFSTDEVLKRDAKEEEKAQNKTSTDKESEPRKKSKDPDAEPTEETSKHPSREESTNASTDKDSKTKMRKVENGGNARRRNRPPAHRRKAELLSEERQVDSESDTNTGMCLRRSPRISKPTQKAVEIQDKKTEKTTQKQENDKDEKEEEEVVEEEEEEETDLKTVQRKPKEKKADQDSQPKPKVRLKHPFLSLFNSVTKTYRRVCLQGRKRRRTRWSNTRTRRKRKNSEDEDENSEEWSTEEEESEEEDDSDEDYKVERSRKRRNRNRERRSSDSSTSSDDDLPPNDDPCKHCGLPNHPELVGTIRSFLSVYFNICTYK